MIARIHFQKKEFAKAITSFDNALVVNKIVFGESHERVGLNYEALAVSYESAGELQKALEYFELANSIFTLTNDLEKVAHIEKCNARIRSKLVENMNGVVSSVEESHSIAGSNARSSPMGSQQQSPPTDGMNCVIM